MLSCQMFANWIRIQTPAHYAVFPLPTTKHAAAISLKNRRRIFSAQSFSSSSSAVPSTVTTPLQDDAAQGVRYDSLRVLEWDKVCDLVASFAATSPGREATRAQLWALGRSYEESLTLLEETDAAIRMHQHGGCRLFFTGVHLEPVELAILNARRGLPVGANEAVAVAGMLELVEALQVNLKAAVKEDADWYNRFMPLSQVVMELVANRQLVKMIRQVVDEDGSVKDSASSALKRARDQVRMLENKLSQLMDSLIRREMRDTSFLEVSTVDGRWCVRSGAGQLTGFKGLLLSSDSGKGSILEPLVAVPLNDELQHARTSVAKAEADVLLMLTEKMQKDLDDIDNIFNIIVRLDMINARATYSLSFGGAHPVLYLPEDSADLSGERNLKASSSKWTLYMPKAYHPLLLQHHRLNMRKVQNTARNASTASAMELAHPIPIDFYIPLKTRVLIITGPNTGGKTICLKTVGLAAIMAKSGLYVLSSESVQIPWFDSVFADIGDEQSLSQSLSTFSGHLKRISAHLPRQSNLPLLQNIRSQSTSQSLVLLDEVGAGTNPLEGASLGMALLESFANSGALLTIATTHHGELKSLKYSNDAFENACMEFDEVNLKPTYKILWGVPGRSNAINISERLGLPSSVLFHARELYGAASAELNEVIVDMERFKQDFQELLYESQHYLTMSRNFHEKLLITRRKILDHSAAQSYRKMQKISEIASMARSTLHKKVRQLRAFEQSSTADRIPSLTIDSQYATSDNTEHPMPSSSSMEIREQSPSVRTTKFPKVGDSVEVSSLGRKGRVLRVDPSKDEILVQAGMMKLKLKLTDILA